MAQQGDADARRPHPLHRMGLSNDSIEGGSKDGSFNSRMHDPTRPMSPVAGYQFDVDAFESVLREKGVLREIESTFNLIAVPLLIVAVIGVGFILVWAEEILVPFVIALFFTYLLRPLVNLLSQPWGNCSEANCLNFFDPTRTCRRRAGSGTPYAGGLQTRKHSHSGEVQASFDHINVAFDEDDGKGTSGAPNNAGSSSGATGNAELEMSNLIDKGERQGELRPRGGFRPPGDASHARIMDPGTSAGPGGVCFRCRHMKIPRWLAILLCMMLVCGFFAGVVVLIADAVQTFEDEDIEQFEERTVEIASGLKDWVHRVFSIDIASMLQEFRKEFHWVSLTKALVLSVVNALEYVFIIFLFVLYMLFEDSDSGSVPLDLSTRVSRTHSHARNLRKQIDMQIQRYLVIKTLISLVVGFGVYVVLGPILEVKMAHIFGVITFFANFIPNFGAMIATLLPIPIILLDPSQTSISMILAITLPVLLHSVVGNLVEPKIFGDTMELHPVVVLISLSFWYTVWGIAGAILSVPITAVVRIVLSHIKHPYAVVCLALLEGKLPGSRAFHAI